MIRRLKKELALLLILSLCMSVSPTTAYAGDGDVITILKRAPVDIVFVIDSTGSMGASITNVKNHIKSFLDTLYDYNMRISEASDAGIGIDPRIAIIDFKDVGLNQSTTFHKNKKNGSYWFVKTADTDDGEELTSTVRGIEVNGGGGDGAETPTNALAMLYKKDDGVPDADGFEWRADAQKFVFLITDDKFKERDHKTNTNNNIPDMSEVITAFKDLNIQTSVVTKDSLADEYSDLYTKTGGKFYNLADQLTFMQEIIQNIDKIVEIPAMNVTVSSSGAPQGIGSIKLVRYMDKDGAEHECPAVYCGDDPVSVSVSLGSLIELEISANKIKDGVENPDGHKYIIEKLTVNGEPLDLSGSDGSGYRIPDLQIINNTSIQAIFKIVEEEPVEAEPATYTVSFDPNGGSQVPPQSVTEGEKASEPNTPERPGYTFNYWYLNNENTPYDFSDPVSSDLTLTASWSLIPVEEEPSVYTVSFNSNGGSPVSPQSIKEGDTVSRPEAPKRDGYTFHYWYLNDERTPYDFSRPVSSDITLTATWILNRKEEVRVEVPLPSGLPSDWTKLRHVTPENAVSTDYCVIASKQRFDVKPHINGAVIYKSSNKSVARVGRKNGVVKAKKSGDAVITGYIKSGKQLIPTGTYNVHVVTPEISKKSYLSFNTDGSIDGNEHIVNEILWPSIWKSSNPSVVTVSSNSGMINVVQSKGKVRITAYYGLGRNAAKYRFTLNIKPIGA